MKTIFAVSALAAAVSTSAIAADTEWEFEFNGAMEAETTINFADDAKKDVFLMTDNDEADGWDMNMNMIVTNGPFSGKFVVDAGDEQKAKGYDGNLQFKLDDITVTEGKFSFGQVGSLMSTDDYLDVEETPIAELAIDDNSVDEVLGVDAGFKYEVTEEFKVQLQGSGFGGSATADLAGTPTTVSFDTNYYGLAAQYSGEADALSYVVEAEFMLDDADSIPVTITDGTNTVILDVEPSAYVFAGAGVSYSTDAVTAMAYLNYSGFEDEEAMQYGVSVETTVAGVTLSGLYLEPSSEVDDDEELEIEVSYGVSDEITVSSAYNYTTVEGTDEVYGKVAWARDAYKASVKLILADVDADDVQPIELDVDASYTSELGVKYYTEFNFQPEDDDSATAETNKFTLGAAYAF